MWKSEISIKSCLSEHTLNTKWTHFKNHKIRIIATVYWESVTLMIFSPEWIYHARCWPLDPLRNIFCPIFLIYLQLNLVQNHPGVWGDFGHPNIYMVFQSNTASRIQNYIVCDLFWTRYMCLTLKKPGLLTPSHSRGGGWIPPLGSRPRSAEKLCNLAHT